MTASGCRAGNAHPTTDWRTSGDGPLGSGNRPRTAADDPAEGGDSMEEGSRRLAEIRGKAAVQRRPARWASSEGVLSTRLFVFRRYRRIAE